MYNPLIWHFIDAKEKEKVQIINLKEIKTEIFLAELFLAYKLCPPTLVAFNKKLEELDTTSMKLVETYNAIIRICGELLRDLVNLLDELVYSRLKDALPTALRHLLTSLGGQAIGYPNQRDTLYFTSTH